MRSRLLTRREAFHTIGSTAIVPLAGCMNRIDSGTKQPANQTEEPEPTASTTTPRPVAKEEFEFDVAVLDQFTEAHTASVRFSFTNTSNRPYVVTPLEFGPSDHGFVVENDARTANIVLVNASMTFSDPVTNARTDPPTEPQDGCWTLDATFSYPVGLTVGEVPPGETITEEFTCYAHRENEHCLPAGAYRFTEEHDFEPGSIHRDRRSGPSDRYAFLVSLLIDDTGALSVDVEHE